MPLPGLADAGSQALRAGPQDRLLAHDEAFGPKAQYDALRHRHSPLLDHALVPDLLVAKVVDQVPRSRGLYLAWAASRTRQSASRKKSFACQQPAISERPGYRSSDTHLSARTRRGADAICKPNSWLTKG